ncbi:MAG TPA: CHC2 zinc finger domain-containing protein [Candidatus Acidoferrales bacterium]|nr:CHC2 zinc finger domain-containing protein [Candidatus Acidoferrales bacterium]
MRNDYRKTSGDATPKLPSPMLSAARVKARVSLAEYIEVSLNIRLRKRGRNLWMRCPFHSERHPSFAVRPDLNLFYCFGCSRGGDVFTFEMLRSSCAFPDAIRRVAEFAALNPADLSLRWKPGEVCPRVEGSKVRAFFAKPPKAAEPALRSKAVGPKARSMIGKRIALRQIAGPRAIPVGKLPPPACAADRASLLETTG